MKRKKFNTKIPTENLKKGKEFFQFFGQKFFGGIFMF